MAHASYYSTDGTELPSVTTIMKILNKPAIAHWANSLGFKRISYKKELDRTALVGTIVHNIVEKKIRTDKKFLFKPVDEFDMNQLDYDSYIQANNAIISFNLWYQQNHEKLNVITTEKSMASDKYGFGGTLDMLAYYEGKLYIIDFKTSSKVHATMFLQLSAYIQLAEENGYNIERVAILRLSKNCGVEFVEMSAKKAKRYFKVFLTLLDIYNNWNEILKEDWNEEL